MFRISDCGFFGFERAVGGVGGKAIEVRRDIFDCRFEKS